MAWPVTALAAVTHTEGGDLEPRLSALARQAEAADLQSALDEVAVRSREQEQQLRQQRAVLRELERQAEEVGHRISGMQHRTANIEKDLERLDNLAKNQDWHARGVESNISTNDFDRQAVAALARASKDLVEPDMGRKSPRTDGHFRQLWRAIQGLDNRLSQEAKRLTTSYDEVLRLFRQGLQQLRSEQSRQCLELDEQLRAERRRLKHCSSEVQARHLEQERRTDAAETRLDALARALASERRVRTESEQSSARASRSSLASKQPTREETSDRNHRQEIPVETVAASTAAEAALRCVPVSLRATFAASGCCRSESC